MFESALIIWGVTVVVLLFACAYYLEKIRESLGWIEAIERKKYGLGPPD